MHRGSRKLLRGVKTFYGDGHREMPLYQQNEKYENGRLNRNVQLFAKVNVALGS